MKDLKGARPGKSVMNMSIGDGSGKNTGAASEVSPSSKKGGQFNKPVYGKGEVMGQMAGATRRGFSVPRPGKPRPIRRPGGGVGR